MAFYSGFFNSKGLDRTYTAEDFTSYLSSIICNGILDTYGQNFKLTAANSGLGVVLGTGKAWIDGHYFINDELFAMTGQVGFLAMERLDGKLILPEAIKTLKVKSGSGA